MAAEDTIPEIGRLGMIIGEGGFGKVYDLESDSTKVVKLIKDIRECLEGKEEFIKQMKVYNTYKTLHESDLLYDKIMVSQPIKNYNNKFNYRGDNYECYFVMSKLNGISQSYFDEYIDSLEEETKRYLRTFNDFMVQLTFNIGNVGIIRRFVGKKYEDPVSESNPLRGYFTDPNDPLLHKIMEGKTIGGEPATFDLLKDTIFQIYRFCYVNSRIVPLDIEITLGIYDEQLKVNILDFGMTINMETYSGEFSIRTYTLKSIYDKIKKEESNYWDIFKHEDMIKLVVNDIIAPDIYLPDYNDVKMLDIIYSAIYPGHSVTSGGNKKKIKKPKSKLKHNNKSKSRKIHRKRNKKSKRSKRSKRSKMQRW